MQKRVAFINYGHPIPLLLIFIISIYFLSSCVSSKKITYFQGETSQIDPMGVAERYVPRIQPGDVLSIQIGSLNNEASSFFNPYTAFSVADRSAQPTSAASPLPQMNGYSVDNTGTIEIPMLGQVKVSGKTIAQVRDQLRESLKEYLKEPTVNVRNLNFRVSVMGEVTRPSLFTIPNEQITLLEALSLSGDVSIYGRRDNVLVIREENGQRTFGRVDLTRRDLFNTPYYYLHPNDVVYVEPGRARAAAAERSTQLLPIMLSALSVLAIIVSRF